MADLSRAKLRDLAQSATGIYEEELELLHGVSAAAMNIRGGMVRAVIEALDAAGYLVMLKRDARLMYGVPTDGVGEHVRFAMETPEGRSISVLGDPNMSDAQRNALGEMMDALANRRAKEETAAAPEPPPTPETDSPTAYVEADARSELYDRIAPVLFALARDGFMPTQGEWNTGKPADLPNWNTLLYKLGCSWAELAARAGLKPRKPGSRPKPPVDEAKTPAPPNGVPRKRGTLMLDENGLAQAVVPDGEVPRIVPNADGRQVRMLGSFGGE